MTPPLHVDHDLSHPETRTCTAGRRHRGAGNTHTATDSHAVLTNLTSFDNAGYLDSRPLLTLDLRHQRLRPAHAQMHAFRNDRSARLILGRRTGRKHVPLRASGD